MDRKHVIALSSLVGGLVLSDANAIGLGEIKLKTFLNEPLKADIQLLQVKDLGESQLIVTLASKEEFAKAGVDRDFLLNSLRFKADFSNPANPRVTVTTDQPIREPFLNFLVELQWPSGRMLREYTLLLDLPAYANNGGMAQTVNGTVVPSGRAIADDHNIAEDGKTPSSAHQAAPVSAPASAGVRVRRATPVELRQGDEQPAHPAPAKAAEPVAAAPRHTNEQPSDPSASAPRAADGQYGPTRASDTLWKIAQRARSGKASVQQTMLAIQRLNPEAFANGNINLLKKGQILRLPGDSDLLSVSRGDASALVDEQTAAWKGKKPVKAPEPAKAPLDATAQATPVEPQPATRPDGKLSLAAPGGAESAEAGKANGVAAADAVKSLKNDLAVGKEELNRIQRENRDMKSRAKDLDAQIANADRLLNLQNNEMAALQARMAEAEKAKAEAQAAADAKAADAARTAEQPQAVEAPAQPAAAEAQQPAAAVDKAPEVVAPVTQAAQPAPVAEEAPAAVPAPAVAPPPVAEVAAPALAKPSVPVKKPAAVEAPVKPGVDSTVLGAVAAVVLFLLGLFGYRKKAAQPAAAAPRQEVPVSAAPKAVAEPQPEAAAAVPVEEDLAAAEEQPVVAEEASKSETGDVMGEADIYISFGNFDKGESLLKSAIASEPQRTDLRLKLLELHKEADNLAGFDAAYRDLLTLGDTYANATASALRNKIPAAAAIPFDAGTENTVAAAQALEDELIDLDLDFSEEPAVAAPVESTQLVVPAVAEDEFVIDLEDSSPAELETAEAPAVDSDLDFDLDLDFATIEPASQAEPQVAPVEEALSLDLEAELAAVEPVVEVVEPAVSADDLDLDFDLDLSSELEAAPAQAAEVPVVEVPVAEVASEQSVPAAVASVDIDDDLDFLTDADEAATKLDLARAYIDMGDKEGAKDILDEVLEEGNDEQKREAQALLDGIA